VAFAEEPSKTEGPVPAQLTVEIFQAPTPLEALNKSYLVYELHLTNYHTAPATLDTLEVQGPGSDGKSFKYQGAILAKLIHPIGSKAIEKNPLLFQPGQAKMVFMWLPFDTKNEIPNDLTHTISLNTKFQNKKMLLNVTTNPLTIEKTPPVIVKPPLKGDYWLAGNGPSNTSEHRITSLVIHGIDYFAQRYAIDFVQLDKNGNTFSGKEHSNKSYHCYGKDILSAAAGKVIGVKNDLPENVPHTGKLAIPIAVDTVGGNYVLVDLGNNNFAFYAHMIPGSITVKEGDVVVAGQVLGKIGNSGNSSEPHLHFHIVSQPSFLGANGIPYAFDSFDVRASKMMNGKNIKVKIFSDAVQHYDNQLVLENTVMKFAD
jgi:hypothetical protein